MLLFGQIGTIGNLDNCLEALSRVSETSIESIDLQELGKRADDRNNIRYFTENLSREVYDERFAKYLFVDTGYTFMKTYPVYFSFTKDKLGQWVGCFVGTEKYIIESASSNRRKINNANSVNVNCLKSTGSQSQTEDGEPESKNTVSDNNDLELADTLKHRLKESESCNCEALERYISGLAVRVFNNYNTTESNEYCIVNADNTKVIVNSGIVDKYGQDIYIMFTKESTMLTDAKLVKSKSDAYNNYAFSKVDLSRELDVVKFYSSYEDLFFNFCEEDIDVDMWGLDHITEERMCRFPEEAEKLSKEELCVLIRNAVYDAVRIAKRDAYYCVPVYFLKMDKICFAIPLYINRCKDNKPQLAVILSKEKGFVRVKTVLSISDVQSNSKSFSLSGNKWLW